MKKTFEQIKLVSIIAVILAAQNVNAQPTNAVPSAKPTTQLTATGSVTVLPPVGYTKSVSAPDYVHTSQPMPDGIIAWDGLVKAVDATNGQDFAKFTFTFTNGTKDVVTVLNVHPSCGCTTAELPPVPWAIPAGATGQIKLSVNLHGKAGTLVKTVNITTDKGSKSLMLKINILSQVMPQMKEDQRAAGIAAAKLDRQAVFKGDCASCHLKNVQGKYGQQLFAVTCAICHEANPRASMVPDLHNLPGPTSEEFWRSWIAAGKAGTLMPAFAASQSGPLDDMKVVSLAAYLNAVNPSRLPQQAAK
jgi:mono/diheme cytochrome c family protein